MTRGKKGQMRRTTFLLLVYLVIGVVVAYAEDYLDNVDRTKPLISAILAIVLWPLVLVGFDVKVT
jgi:nitrate reductase NapE component